jgi:alkanesulfonate monooxygenase SsuD/methylene tetrahydromethanopterin reductase-like flavin-dependent oxidoreductase (luciferase family)
VILPWNDPLRVAEKISLLDHLAGGRVLFGVGRAWPAGSTPASASRWTSPRTASTRPPAWWWTPWRPAGSRATAATTTQPRTPIRPAPAASFRDRLYCVAMSPDSVLAGRRPRARMVTFSQRPWEDQAVAMATYRERFEAPTAGARHPR